VTREVVAVTDGGEGARGAAWTAAQTALHGRHEQAACWCAQLREEAPRSPAALDRAAQRAAADARL